MTITENQSPAEMFRSAVASFGFTIIDDVPDDLTREQLVEVLEALVGQMRAYAAEARA